jgi:single-stranded-DNA-specific exonuclease
MDSARNFFACDTLADPFELSDMSKAVHTIRGALDEGKKITVFGDYDCDGVTSTVMLYSYLEAMGADVDFYIPDRSEGYGMNIPAVEKILDRGTELIITVDNGISALEEAKYIASRNATLVVTDHHQPLAELPVCAACVDPHRADDLSAFKDICGAGVVLKLLCALEEDGEFVMEQYAELAAVGTIGDVVPLKGENRYIVRRGLENIRNGQNLGLGRLIVKARVSPENITSTQIAYSVCPRINAAGRMAVDGGESGAMKAVRLLMADSSDEAERFAEELEALNAQRKTMQENITAEIERQFAEDGDILRQRVIIAAGNGWHHGVIGIVAAHFMEKYGKPVFVISVENGEARGSARSFDGFSIHKALLACSELLTKFGGHPKAGGFSFPAEKLDEFKSMMYDYCRKNYPKMPEAEICADMETNCGELTIENVELLNRLEPFGEGNKQPKLLLKNCVVKSKRALKDGKYTSFEVESGGKTLKALSFDLPFDRFFAKVGERIDIIANAEINSFNGNRSVNLKVKELRPSDFREDRFFAAQRVYEEIRRGEGCDSRLAPRVIPQDRAALIAVYDMVKRYGSIMSAEEMCVYVGMVNYCMLRITMDAFAEAGMIELSPNAQRAVIVPVKEKKDLFETGLLAELKKNFPVKKTWVDI